MVKNPHILNYKSLTIKLYIKIYIFLRDLYTKVGKKESKQIRRIVHETLVLFFITTSHGSCALRVIIFLGLSLFFFSIFTKLVNSNINHNHIFIYYRINHKM